ncbi:MAG TPA: hypothetical protein VJ866_04280 [Pyrinomonadaceae bacterium]|nr:hypothetical protein [Pyrinomonadaceae bacterium]
MLKRALSRTLALMLLVAACGVAASAQSAKLPSAEKVVGDYLKAVGGRKRVATLRDATYEWTVQAPGRAESSARIQTKSPSSVRMDVDSEAGQVVTAVNPRMAWRLLPAGGVETLTGAEAFGARLRGTLGAGRFFDFKKMKVLARTTGAEQVGGETAYVVEFSTREGGRARYWFGAASKLLLKSDDPWGGFYFYEDYRPEGGLLESHRGTHQKDGKTDATYVLKSVRYNTGLADTLFEPPADASLDIPSLLRDLAKNQDEDDKRVNDYTFTQKITERELDDNGRVKKEKVSVYEVYPIADYGLVQKLVSENGVPLTPERAAKEEKRVAEELEKAEREAPKMKEKRERARAELKKKMREKAAKSGEEVTDDDPEEVAISTFLRACEFVSPRRERLQGRDVIVFDFRPRAGFKPSNMGESIVSKLSGVIWVDPQERQVMRLEGRLVDSFKVGGGLLASIKSGSAFVFEQTRLEDGIWLPRYSQVNASARVILFKGMTINQTQEFSDYKRFSAKTGEDKLDAPKEKPQEQ